MSDEAAHHSQALIETAKLELGRAHNATLTMEAGELRRGLTLAAEALRAVPEDGRSLRPCLAKMERALADLDAGSLAEMGTLIEDARKELEAL